MQNALNYDSLAAEAFKPANFCKLFAQVAVKAFRLMVTVHNESRKFSEKLGENSSVPTSADFDWTAQGITVH